MAGVVSLLKNQRRSLLLVTLCGAALGAYRGALVPTPTSLVLWLVGAPIAAVVVWACYACLYHRLSDTSMEDCLVTGALTLSPALLLFILPLLEVLDRSLWGLVANPTVPLCMAAIVFLKLALEGFWLGAAMRWLSAPASPWAAVVLVSAMGAFLGVFWWMVYKRYMVMESGPDISIFNQLVWSTLHEGWPGTTIEGRNYFGTHNSPTLFLVLPIYALYEGPLTLQFLNTALLSLGAVPLYLLSKLKLGGRFPAVSVAIAYLNFPQGQLSAIGDFHPECMIPFLFFSGVYMLERQRTGAAVAFFLLAMGVREDMD